MSEFKLLPGMQVVERNIAKKGTCEEYTVSTFHENCGWIEKTCSAFDLDAVKQGQIEDALLQEEKA